MSCSDEGTLVFYTHFFVSSLWSRKSWSMEKRSSHQSWALLAVWWLRFVCWISTRIWSFARHPFCPSDDHCSGQRWSSSRRRHPTARERRPDENFWWNYSSFSFEENWRVVFEKFHHLMNLLIHVVDSLIRIRPTISTGEYYHRWMISEIRSPTMIKYRAKHTKRKHADRCVDAQAISQWLTEKNGRNVGEESSSALKRKTRWERVGFI